MTPARITALIAATALPGLPAEPTIAVVGLVHSHVWGHLGKMIANRPARLVGIAETREDLIAEARKRGAAQELFHADYKAMLDTVKPAIVWAFVENNRHLEIVEACAPRGIHVIFEKPLASSYGDALAIQRVARKHRIQVMTNYQMVWWPANYTAKRLVDSGALGKVWRLRGIVGHGGPGGATGLNRHFFEWLTDPEKNGAGALMDFGCYNALWSLWYMGRPERVYAHVNHLRPETFPKVEDNSTMILSYPNGVGLFEGSWDLPRGFQDLEIYGLGGSVYMKNGKVTRQPGREAEVDVPLDPLPPEKTEPIAYMVDVLGRGAAVEGLAALDINVGVVEIIEAAKQSIRTGEAVRLPLTR
ncbi:MAG: Gfo/Idh/MocA family oxidoreductase [Acidobacteria bacterium]|nr:Gfo/Idh/MocA family oxidoreductase [Acidobacteriota bacterium]